MKRSINEIERAIGIKARVRNIVEEYYQIDISKVIRVRVYVEARSMYSKLLRDNTSMTYESIGESIGKDHTSVYHMVRQLESEMRFDSELNSKYVRLSSIYNESIQQGIDEDNALVEISISYNKLRDSYKMLAENYKLLMDKHNQLVNERERRERRRSS